MRKKRKNKKLLLQVIAIAVPVFIIMLVAIIWSIYESAVDGFLSGKKPHMEYVLDEQTPGLFGSTEVLNWYLKEWGAHPQVLTEDYKQEEGDAYYEASIGETEWSIAWMDSLPEPAKNYQRKIGYESLNSNFTYYAGESGYDMMFILDMRESNRGFVICEYIRGEEARSIGKYYNIDLEDHPVLKKLYDRDDGRTVFERTKDFPYKGRYYIGYIPIYHNGELQLVIGVVCRLDSFRSTMNITLITTILVGVAGILIALLLLVVMLNRKAIEPIAALQKTVLKYREDKDSDAVQKRVSEIKVRNEIGVLADDIAELAVEIDQYTNENIRLVGEKERVSAELDMARKIQTEQLPNVFPAFPDREEFDIFASMTPAKEVGGDFYDFFMIDDDHLALVMADVSGKGIPAALFMMMAKMLINNNAMMGLTPHEILEKTNETICKNNKERMFVTVWLGILEISTGKLTASNAGHEYPLIRRPDGEFELFKDPHGFVIGGRPGKKYKEYELTLEKGSTFFVYTDGIPEATDAEEKAFGTDRLLEALNRSPEDVPEKLVNRVKETVTEFVGEAPQFDDLTMLGIKIL